MSGTPLRPGMTVIRAPLQQSALGKTIIRTPVVVQQGVLPTSRLFFFFNNFQYVQVVVRFSIFNCLLYLPTYSNVSI